MKEDAVFLYLAVHVQRILLFLPVFWIYYTISFPFSYILDLCIIFILNSMICIRVLLINHTREQHHYEKHVHAIYRDF